MRSVGIKTLKNKLSAYVRLASQGEVVLVTDRDQVVAELVPPRGSRAEDVADAALAHMVRTGLVSPPLFAAATIPPSAPPVATLAELLAELDHDRDR